MIKTVEVIVIIALIIISFFLGVKYSNSVKTHMSWLETQDEQEVELPDLSDESPNDSTGNEASDQNPQIIDNTDSAIDPTAQINQANTQENNNIAPNPSAPQAPQAPVQAVPAN